MLSLIVIGMRPPLASTCQVLSFQALPELPCIALLNMMMMIRWACIKTWLGIVVSSLLSPSDLDPAMWIKRFQIATLIWQALVILDSHELTVKAEKEIVHFMGNWVVEYLQCHLMAGSTQPNNQPQSPWSPHSRSVSLLLLLPRHKQLSCWTRHQLLHAFN